MVGEGVGDVAQQPRAVERHHLDPGDEGRARCSSPSHSTSISRAACSAISDTALAQSARCTLTPRPRVTKPMISSPGTGVQQFARRTSTSSSPSTCTPTRDRPPSARARRGELMVAGSCSSSSPRPEALGETLGDRLRPTRGARRWRRAARRGRRSSTRSIDLVQLRSTSTSAAPADPRGGTPSVSSSRPASIMSIASLAGEPLPDLVARARRRDELQPVLRWARRLDLGGEDLARVAARQHVVERARADR